MTPLPRPLLPFMEFSALLRANDFSVAPEQTQSFIAAVGLLGPRTMEDIHRAAHATIAPSPERRDEFDALFRLAFLGQSLPASAPGEPDQDEVEAFDDRDGGAEPPETEEAEESGGAPTGAERLFARQFAKAGESEALRRFRRAAPRSLPRRKSRRLMPAKGRGRLDMRRALRDAVKRDGEVIRLPALTRRERRRRILLLIDISGSMKNQTDTYLRFGHTLAQASDRVEVFTLGTRLTRITRALRRRNPDQALGLASTLVADWDGGTRLGDALQAFLSVPRFAGFSRGALCVILSDGLERGDHVAMTDAVERLSRHAWALLWLSPLAGENGYAVETAALRSVLGHIDRLGDGSSAARVCAEVLGFERRIA
ncbi:VWA domain-containing protein [Aquamicrobium sp. LC103]|uniref:vWA domain-containing protein n=1 Tax=Aquamicrobium sp. LC103 TaxID=1120658 RepID=UPI00063E9FC9|nr:VWA domain-containing protein [Aquamicrobium sp. LC103]TKT76213.1 VWA domain-containing protein [Aquamicrobium sp. LC103]